LLASEKEVVDPDLVSRVLSVNQNPALDLLITLDENLEKN
jgi:hypothetical protein